jgi:hypothetical protein
MCGLGGDADDCLDPYNGTRWRTGGRVECPDGSRRRGHCGLSGRHTWHEVLKYVLFSALIFVLLGLCLCAGNVTGAVYPDSGGDGGYNRLPFAPNQAFAGQPTKQISNTYVSGGDMDVRHQKAVNNRAPVKIQGFLPSM